MTCHVDSFKSKTVYFYYFDAVNYKHIIAWTLYAINKMQ